MNYLGINPKNGVVEDMFTSKDHVKKGTVCDWIIILFSVLLLSILYGLKLGKGIGETSLGGFFGAFTGLSVAIVLYNVLTARIPFPQYAGVKLMTRGFVSFTILNVVFLAFSGWGSSPESINRSLLYSYPLALAFVVYTSYLWKYPKRNA